MNSNNISEEDKYFLVSFDFDKTWDCIKLHEYVTSGKARNVDYENGSIEIIFNKKWYKGTIHSSNNEKSKILQRGERLMKYDDFKDFKQSDNEAVQTKQKAKEDKIGIICFNYKNFIILYNNK